MPHIKFQGSRSTGPEKKKIFKSFYYLLAWPPSWSCDLDHLTIFDASAQEGSTLNLGMIGPVASEEMFEIVIL